MRFTLITVIMLVISNIAVWSLLVFDANKQFVEDIKNEEFKIKPNIQSAVVDSNNQIFKVDSNDQIFKVDSEAILEDKDSIVKDTVYVINLEASHTFRTRSIIITGILLIFFSIVMYFMADIFLKPIKKLTSDISSLEPDNLSTRVSTITNSGELTTLANSFNALLERIESAFSRQKRFSSNIAHELKTPLTTMKTNLEVFDWVDDFSKQETVELIAVLKNQNNRMIELVNNLLHFAKTNQIDKIEMVSIKILFEQIIVALQNEIENKNLSVTINVLDFPLKGNAILLKNAFQNIVINAIKYNKINGKIEIFTDENNFIHIKDSGIGIEADQWDKIFEPLYRVNQSRNRDIAGAGLGLSLSHEIIKCHGGSINVLSDGETYTEFIIDVTVPF